MRFNRIRVIPLICFFMTSYFIFHTIQGNRGLRRSWQLDEEIVLAEKLAKKTGDERKLMQAKVRSLSPESLDLDQLEESAHRILNMGDKNTLILQ